MLNKHKISLLVNFLFLLISILFINFKKAKIISNDLVTSIQTGISTTPQVLSENSDLVSYAKVVRVIDGDTIELDNGEKVRYIGMDSPERTNGGECYYLEALNKNSELVLGKTVRLERDVSERDKYNRLLMYVYVGEIFVNEVMVSDGYATVATYPPDVKYKDTFINAERRAREEGKGLWGECRVEK